MLFADKSFSATLHNLDLLTVSGEYSDPSIRPAAVDGNKCLTCVHSFETLPPRASSIKFHAGSANRSSPERRLNSKGSFKQADTEDHQEKEP